jgi:hypothetical protein
LNGLAELVAGLPAVAALATVWFTMRAAKREVAAAQSRVDTALRIERRRVARESYAFMCLLDASLRGVVRDVEAVQGAAREPQGGRRPGGREA